MGVNYLDIRGAGFSLGPGETNPPLIVDTDAVLSFSFTLERLEAIARQSGEVGERNCCIQAIEFETGCPLKSGERSNGSSRRELGSLFVPKPDDHCLVWRVIRDTSSVFRGFTTLAHVTTAWSAAAPARVTGSPRLQAEEQGAGPSSSAERSDCR